MTGSVWKRSKNTAQISLPLSAAVGIPLILSKQTGITMTELEKRIAAIDAKESEQPSAEDLAAFAAANAEDSSEMITLDEYKAQKEYSGKLMLRVVLGRFCHGEHG